MPIASAPATPVATPTTPTAPATAIPAAQVPPVATPAAGTQPAAVTSPPAAPPEKESRIAVEKMQVLRDRKALADEKTKWAAEKAAHDAKLGSLSKIEEARASKNAAQALLAAGWTPEEVAEMSINGEITPVDPKVAALEKQMRDLLDKQTGSEKAQQDAALLAEKAEATAAINAKPEDFPTISALGLHEQVFAKMANHYTETGEALTPVEAAALVEPEANKWLGENLKKAITNPKIRALMAELLGGDTVKTDAKTTDPKPSSDAKTAEASKMDAKEPSILTAPKKQNWTQTTRKPDVERALKTAPKSFDAYLSEKLKG